MIPALAFARRHWKMIGMGLLLAAIVALYIWGDGWRSTAHKWQSEAQTVVIALREASGNDKVAWDTAPGQIVALGQSNRALSAAIGVQNERIDEMARQAVRAKARAAELKAIADRAEAQKASALRRLSNLAITPGTRSDCIALLREADDALNVVREASE